MGVTSLFVAVSLLNNSKVNVFTTTKYDQLDDTFDVVRSALELRPDCELRSHPNSHFEDSL